MAIRARHRSKRMPPRFVVERGPMPAHWDWPLDAPVALEVPAQAFDWRPTNAQALPPGPVSGGQPATIRLIPYGCAKFHISMFPVTPKVECRPRRDRLSGGSRPSTEVIPSAANEH